MRINYTLDTKNKIISTRDQYYCRIVRKSSHGGSFPSNLSDGDAGWNIAIQFDDIYDNDTDNELRI